MFYKLFFICITWFHQNMWKSRLQCFIHDFSPYSHTAGLVCRVSLPLISGLRLPVTGWRTVSRTACSLWPCRHTWNLFHQTQMEEFRGQTPCSSFPVHLRGQTPTEKRANEIRPHESLVLSYRLQTSSLFNALTPTSNQCSEMHARFCRTFLFLI